jgi:hypothetical protein
MTKHLGRMASCTLLLLASGAGAQPYAYTEIAREFAEGTALGWLDVDVRPAIAENGTVAFSGYKLGSGITGETDRLFASNGGPVSFVEVKAGFAKVRSVHLNSAGTLVFEGERRGYALDIVTPARPRATAPDASPLAPEC